MTTTARRTNSTRTLARAATALAAALVPVLAGLALLCSKRARRNAIALFGGDHTASAHAAQIGKTWGIGLLIIGVVGAALIRFERQRQEKRTDKAVMNHSIARAGADNRTR